MRLIADLWDNNYASPTWLARLGVVAELGADWDNPGGLQRAGLVVRTPGRDAWEAYTAWAGQRLIVHVEGWPVRPCIDATVVKPALLRGRVGLVAAGPWWRCMFNELETDVPGAADNSDDVIKTALTNHATTISSDQSGIEATSMPAVGLTMPIEGLHPGRLVEEYIKAGDGDGNSLLFWIEPAPFDHLGRPGKPVAKLLAVKSTGTLDWQVWPRDIVRGSMQLELDISDLATAVEATYSARDYTRDSEQATLTYQNSDTEFKDTGQDFSAWQTAAGTAVYQIEITNSDDTTCRAYLGAVVPATSNQQIDCYKDRAMSEAGFSGADPSGKTPSAYRVTRVDGQRHTAQATNNTADYWSRARAVSARGISSTNGATEVRDTELARLSSPQLRHGFTIGSAFVQDGSGRPWPLINMLAGGGYLRNSGIGATDGALDSSLDHVRVGRITSMRYDHTARQMSVALGERLTLDTILSKFGYNWQAIQQLGRELVPLFG